MCRLLLRNHHLTTSHGFISFRFQDELMRVPLPGIVAILSSNHPGVASQEAVYDFALRWADSNYPNSEERRKILSSSLLPLVSQVCSRTNAIQIDHPSSVSTSHGHSVKIDTLAAGSLPGPWGLPHAAESGGAFGFGPLNREAKMSPFSFRL